jgi:hypothetical protein
MHRSFILAVVSLLLVPVRTTAAPSAVQLQMSLAGSGQPVANAPASGIDLLLPAEIDPAFAGDDEGDDLGGFGVAAAQSAPPSLHRSIAISEGRPRLKERDDRGDDRPVVRASFDGLTHRDTRLANGGNQFSNEPPDQGLCAGNGFVLESVNSALRIYDRQGNPLTGVVDLNTFYGYPAAINRATGQFGPSLSDPSCVYDSGSRRWFHVILTLDRIGTSSALSGKNHLDIAVSSTADPRDPWRIYRLPVQNDGTDGTPDHHCDGPCLGDYPHIGFNRDGIYLTTNEFSLFGTGFFGAQIYAISKRALINGAASVPVVLINTADPDIPFPGFTVWPAQPVGEGDDDDDGGGRVEYLMSSLAVFTETGTSNQILVWKLTNTRSLDRIPSIGVEVNPVEVTTYAVPPRATQKVGDFPLGQCLADATIPTPAGPGCWRFVLASGGPFPNTEKQRIDGHDSRVNQVTFARGKLWTSLETAVSVGGATQVGLAYFIVDPGKLSVVKEGTLALAGNNLTYGAVGVSGEGKGAIAFSLLGTDFYPTAAYASLDIRSGAGPIRIVSLGKGPDDGFTGYNPTSQFGTRQRWGDYGAAAFDGKNLWLASEYIGQSCTLAEFVSSNFTCGATRTQLGNWYTRLTKLSIED